MERLRSDDAEIVYDIVGNGPPVVLLHPFPVHHKFWNRIVPMLSSRYRLILPDLRGHGDSEIGKGPATMGKHARDLAHLLDAVGEAKAALSGIDRRLPCLNRASLRASECAGPATSSLRQMPRGARTG